MSLKVSLTERVSLEARGVVVGEQRFPGRQGRLVFAYLLAARGRPVPKDQLAEALWGDEPPARSDKALSVLVSKLRALLNECGVDGSTALTSAFGCYQLVLPAGSWIDVSVADEAADAAEQALAVGDWNEARANATTAESLARRTFLPGEDGRWVGEQRAELREVLVRALESLAEANRLGGDPVAAARAAEELITREPFRESGYRLLMQAQSAAGNDAEALRTYERCRTLLAEELGAYPSPETEAVYLEILRAPSRTSTVQRDQVAVDGARPPTSIVPEPRQRRRAKRAALGVVVLAAALGGTAAIATNGDEALPVVIPNSVVQIDPQTLEPAKVVRVGRDPDLVVLSGGFLWVTHLGRRYTDDNRVRNSGERTVMRVDTSTGEADVVGGGLAPCGVAPDPSGDVWIANCFAARSGVESNVVRVDAETLEFEATWPLRAGVGYFRGLAYGGGSLWVADASGTVDYHGVTRVDPQTGAQRRFEFDRHAGWLAWSGAYGDLWMNDFERASVSRMNATTGAVKTFEGVGVNPAPIVVAGDAVWVGDWDSPQVIRLPAVGSAKPRNVTLPVRAPVAGVTTVAADAGWIWTTVPDSRAVWRIDPRTNDVTRIGLRYYPWGVAAADDQIWVAVRGRSTE